MNRSKSTGKPIQSPNAAMKKLSERRAQKLATIAQELEKDGQPSPDEVDELERLGKLEAIFKSGNARLTRQLELIALSVVVLVLIGLCFVRLRSTSVDLEVRATEVRFNLDKGTSTTLIPGETGQILTLKKAAISGIETMSPETSTDGGTLQLKAAAPPDRNANTKTEGNYDPSVRLFAIAIPSESAFSIQASVAYSGNSRGLNLTIEGAAPVKASFGQVIPIPFTSKGVKSEEHAINHITMEGKALQLSLYPADELHELAVFRDLHVSSITFENAGRSTILSGTAYIRGRGASGLPLRPSDLLVLSSRYPMLLREITLARGELKAIVSVPKATTILLGEDAPRDLRPTLFQWILYRWPNELYAALSALIAVWLALRRWWGGTE
jgi:hypothetical protein